MREKVNELESKLSELLPRNPTSEADPQIAGLTRDLIKAGENVWETIGYTHSVCHLFEKYGHGKSFLNSTAILPVAEELVDYTLKKALEEYEFGCVGRIVYPIMCLNLAHMEENPKVFAFKPKILEDAKFIEKLSLSGEVKSQPYLVDFCKSKSIGEFFPKYTEALRMEKKLDAISNAAEIVPGVFIDVDGSLIDWGTGIGRSEGKAMPMTQEYALRKIAEGAPVTVFTGGDLDGAIEGLRAAGIDQRLLDVQPKSRFIGRTLEICIDDTAPAIQGFRARTHYQSGQIAWDSEYKGK